MQRVVLALAAMSLLACGEAIGTGASRAVGAWNLITVDGDPPPFTIEESAGYRLEVISDRFVAHSNGSWTDDLTLRETINGIATTTTESDVGAWAQSGSTVTITASDGTVSTVQISGDTITFVSDGSVFLYARE